MSTKWIEEEARVWRAWHEATGRPPEAHAAWHRAGHVDWTGVLAWPVRLHPMMPWLNPPLYDRPLPPVTFAELAAALAEAPVPAGSSVGDLVDPSYRNRACQGAPLLTAFGPVLPAGTAVRVDDYCENPCAGPWTWIEATVLGTAIGDLPVAMADHAGAVFLLARLAVVHASDPLASDHARAEEVHRQLVAVLDRPEDGAPPEGHS